MCRKHPMFPAQVLQYVAFVPHEVLGCAKMQPSSKPSAIYEPVLDQDVKTFYGTKHYSRLEYTERHGAEQHDLTTSRGPSCGSYVAVNAPGCERTGCRSTGGDV